MTRCDALRIRALRTKQGSDVDVYSFFVQGDQVTRLADITRIRREQNDLEGFQRREIKSHVSEIAAFLSQGDVLFPNAIILALSPEVRFEMSRGPRDEGEAVQSGRLTIPLRPEGQRTAWVVDGQQRSLALARAGRADLLVPVVGFVSSSLQVQREQFILVNKARPLPSRLINELLPEVGVSLPRDLKGRQIPSALLTALNQDPRSPFAGLLRRESAPSSDATVVTDTALLQAIRANLRPGGALGAYTAEEGLEPLHEALCTYWRAVRNTFGEAWGRPATESRLMHSAGIQAMGALMDPIWTRADATSAPSESAEASLARLAPHCRWTDGRWDELGWLWNDVQNTQKHVRALTDFLIRKDRGLSRPMR